MIESITDCLEFLKETIVPVVARADDGDDVCFILFIKEKKL